MHPSLAPGRRIGCKCQARFDEDRQDALLRTLEPRRIGQSDLHDLGTGGMIGAHLALGGKLRIGASAQEGGHLLRDDVGLALLPCKFILGFDEEPWVFLLARFSAHAHEMPAALEARAVKGEIEMAFGKSVVGIEFRPPGAAIPHDHGAAAIFALGDDTLPVEILHRVVFGFNRQALVVGMVEIPVVEGGLDGGIGRGEPDVSGAIGQPERARDPGDAIGGHVPGERLGPHAMDPFRPFIHDGGGPQQHIVDFLRA